MALWSVALLPVLFDSSLRALFIAGGVAVTLAIFRVRSGSIQHAAWTAALCAMLLMPVLPSLVPAIEIPGRIPAMLSSTEILQDGNFEVPAQISAVVQTIAPPSADPVPKSPSGLAISEVRHVWPSIAFVLYSVVLGVLGIRFGIGWISMRRLIRQSSYCPLANSTVIFESGQVASPVTLGFLSPKIVLPDGWRLWPKLKRRAILTHEIAHVRRRDPLVRLMAQVHCCVFWFNPLSWWIKRKLSAVAEHACDEATLRIVGEPQRYAEILLDFSETVRRHGGRVSWQGLGIQGNGMMASRIDRILRFGNIPRLTMTRKVMVALTAAVFLILAVACQQRVSTSIEEETQALRQFTAERVQQQNTIHQWQELNDVLQDAGRLTPPEVLQLESRVAQNPDNNIIGRKRLVYYYWSRVRGSISREDLLDVIAPRRRHILWLIQHRPDDPFSGASPMYIPSDPSIVASDPAGHEQEKEFWLTQTGRNGVSSQVLHNAAVFFESEEKPLAEQLLLRVRAVLSNDESTNDGNSFESP